MTDGKGKKDRGRKNLDADEARSNLPEAIRKLRLMDLDLDMDESRMDRLKQVMNQLPDRLVADFFERVKLEKSRQNHSLDQFVSSHSISKAEANLLSNLLKGNSVAEHADETGTSVNTARTHMRRLLEKTGSTSQVDLIRKFYSATD